MATIRSMKYTKEDGSSSLRSVVVLSKPREHYLMYDVSKLTTHQREYFLTVLSEMETLQDETIAEFEAVTGLKQKSLWRSFKPEGIEWTDGNEI